MKDNKSCFGKTGNHNHGILDRSCSRNVLRISNRLGALGGIIIMEKEKKQEKKRKEKRRGCPYCGLSMHEHDGSGFCPGGTEEYGGRR